MDGPLDCTGFRERMLCQGPRYGVVCHLVQMILYTLLHTHTHILSLSLSLSLSRY